MKSENNIRLLYLNPHGFGPDDIEKTKMLCKTVREMKINRILMSSPDRRWVLTRVNRIKNIFKRISKNVTIILSDSRENPNNMSG